MDSWPNDWVTRTSKICSRCCPSNVPNPLLYESIPVHDSIVRVHNFILHEQFPSSHKLQRVAYPFVKKFSADQIPKKSKEERLCLPGNNFIKLPPMDSLWYPPLGDKQLTTSEENQSSPAVRCKTLF